MANITRNPCSSSNWTERELMAYNIVIQRQSSEDFFGFEPNSSLIHIDQDFVTSSLDIPSDNISDYSGRLLEYLKRAAGTSFDQRSAISDFSREVLRVVGYEERETLLRTRYSVPFTICTNSSCSAQFDVSLLHNESTILLIVQGVRTDIGIKSPEPQIVADAIAAFQFNNRIRYQYGLDELEAMTIPCIAIIGTVPIFYKVPVTSALNDAVINGQYPSKTTCVFVCTLPPLTTCWNDGLEKPVIRQAALQYLDAFKIVAKSLWSEFL